MSLCVVEFDDDGGLLIVHAKWLVSPQECYCPPYWANGSKLKRAILAVETPNKDTWKSFKMRILRRADTYEEAVKILNQAETVETSDLGIELPIGRGCRNKITRRVSASSSSPEYVASQTVKKSVKPSKTSQSELNRILDPPTLRESVSQECPVSGPSPKTASNSIYGPQIFYETEVQEFFTTEQTTASEVCSSLRLPLTVKAPTVTKRPEISISPACSPGVQNNTQRDESLMTHILRQMAVMNAKLDSHGEMLLALLQTKKDSETDKFIDPPFDLPLSTRKELEDLENLVTSNSSQKSKLTKFLATVGGSTCNETTYRVLARLMKNDLAKEYSWAGVTGKMSFKNLMLKVIVCDAVMENPLAKNPREKEIEEAIKYWLKRANCRINLSTKAATDPKQKGNSENDAGSD